MATDWPVHGSAPRPWRSTVRGPREDRQLTEIQVSLPPYIAELDAAMPGPVLAAAEAAVVSIATLDARFGDQLSTFGSFLVRSEAVSSSRIEQHSATLDDLAKATIGLKASGDAMLTLAAARAVQQMVDAAASGTISLDDVLNAHRKLLGDDIRDGRYAGKLRTVQNWIGGSDYSPRGAIHVPPPPESVDGYMDDLLRFVNRADIPVLVQAGIAHAQFESIHPFTDGNGRIGRALINAILRRRGVTTRLVVPIASALVADVEQYFARVNAYRDGHAGQFVAHLAQATAHAADEAQTSARLFAELPSMWRAEVRPRAGSATAKVIDILLESPVLDIEIAALRTGAGHSSVYDALARLTAAGVLHEVTRSKRDRAWAATDVLAEIDALNARLRRLKSDAE